MGMGFMSKRLIDDVSSDAVRGFQGNAIRTRPLLETGDVAEELGLTYWGVRYLVAAGQLRVWNRTLRGAKLFDPREVERVLLARAERTRQRRLERLRQIDVEPRRMLRATLPDAKAKGSSLQDAAAKGSENARKTGRVA
jgi:DNA-binding transcriptional MerR regulator